MNIEIANRQLRYLLESISRALEALSLFGLLRNKKFTTGTIKQDNWLEEILLSFIVLKIHTIFDKSRDAVCLEKFLKSGVQYIVAEEADRQSIIEMFNGISRDH